MREAKFEKTSLARREGTLNAMVLIASDILIMGWRSLGSGVASTRRPQESPPAAKHNSQLT